MHTTMNQLMNQTMTTSDYHTIGDDTSEYGPTSNNPLRDSQFYQNDVMSGSATIMRTSSATTNMEDQYQIQPLRKDVASF